MLYLICDKCGGHYELQSGESPEDLKTFVSVGEFYIVLILF